MSFVDEACQAIREAGGRFTAQRRLIVELLEGAESHLDAERLYHLARDRDESVSLATVYRTLHVLEETGLIDHRHFPTDYERRFYEPATGEEHHHFTCLNCHRVIEFESEWVDALKRDLETKLGVRILSASVHLEGLCPVCGEAGN